MRRQNLGLSSLANCPRVNHDFEKLIQQDEQESERVRQIQRLPNYSEFYAGVHLRDLGSNA